VDSRTDAPGGWDRRDWILLGGLLLIALGVRGVFLWRMELPVYDPWRHLQLIRNLREGAGFTLFDGQPYLWYSPIWYRLAALLPGAAPMELLAALLSAASAPLLYVAVRLEGTRSQGLAAGLLGAASGPLVAFTCHYGPEALALFLTLGGLLLIRTSRGSLGAFLAGLSFGVALVARVSFVFNLFLFIPGARRRERALGLSVGLVVPLLLTWWRNHRIIEDHSWLFTWDGLATPSADFGPLSTLAIQLHPAVQAGLSRLHAIIVPWPEWLRGADGFAWGSILFMACAVAGLLASRRPEVILAGGATLGYFLVFDRSMSSHFFRIYLATFPALFIGVAACAGRSGPSVRRGPSWLGWALVGVMLIAGASYLSPPVMYPLEMVTAPPELLDDEAYMVNSGFYHPSSLIYRYPEKRFIGMPLGPERFEEFRVVHADYPAILWHDFSVQDELHRFLLGPGGYTVVREGANAYGRRFQVLERELPE